MTEQIVIAIIGGLLAGIVVAAVQYFRGRQSKILTTAVRAAASGFLGLAVMFAVMAALGWEVEPAVIVVIISVAVVMALQATAATTCPNCGARLPGFRFPRSWRQLLWDETTCRTCGKEVDRHGNLRTG